MNDPQTKRAEDVEGLLLVRALRPSDYEQVRDLQLKCFPGMKPWLREQFESQIRHFPEGQLCVEIDGKVVASSSSLLVDFDLYSEWHNWAEISDSGFIRNHEDDGDTLYGIEIMVDPEYRGYRLSRRLYDARKQLARERNLARIIIGGRIPGYHRHAAEMSAQEYVDRVIAKALYDPVLTAQLANGFVLQRLIPNYLPNDSESCGYATFLQWTNYDYRTVQKRHFRAVEPVRIAAVQYQMRTLRSFEEFALQCEYFVDVAADAQSDFVLFPELITAQLLSLVPPMRPGLAVRRIAKEFAEPYRALFSRLAIKHNINIIAGSHFTLDDEDVLRNTAHVFMRNGREVRQHKLHVTTPERKWWGLEPGDRLEVFDTDRGKIAILASYDVEFPELARIAAKKGAHILFVPFNTDSRYAYLRMRYCAQARCIENHVYVVSAGCTGNLPFVDNADVHYAQSAIFTPSDISFSRDGVAAETTANDETVLVHDLDIKALRRHRYTGSTQNWNDRRRDLYLLRYFDGNETREV